MVIIALLRDDFNFVVPTAGRRMHYIANHDAFAYEADSTRLVLFGEEGHAFLSKDMGEKLHEIIGW